MLKLQISRHGELVRIRIRTHLLDGHVQIERSADFKSWEATGFVRIHNGFAEFLEPGTATEKPYFYRAKSESNAAP